MFPVQELTKAGVDWTKPNRHGVSPLLLLLRHTSDGKLLPAAVQDELLHGVWKQNWSRQVCALRWLQPYSHLLGSSSIGANHIQQIMWVHTSRSHKVFPGCAKWRQASEYRRLV
jgi:hypothetical protein